MEMNFCRRCGSKLAQDQEFSYNCKRGHLIFKNSVPTATLYLVNEANELLVGVRALEPGKDQLDIPGGFCDGDESIETTLEREMQEEVGLSAADYSKPMFFMSSTSPYTFKGEVITVLDMLFWARINAHAPIKPGDDLREAYFVSLESLDASKIYFESLQQGVAKLKQIIK